MFEIVSRFFLQNLQIELFFEHYQGHFQRYYKDNQMYYLKLFNL
jgi:hypothetical protein